MTSSPQLESETLAFRDWYPGLPVGVALVFGARPNQTVVPVLLQHVGSPTGHAANSENGRKEIDGNAQRIIGRRRIEIDVGVQPLRRFHGVLHFPRKAEKLLVTCALAQFFG